MSFLEKGFNAVKKGVTKATDVVKEGVTTGANAAAKKVVDGYNADKKLVKKAGNLINSVLDPHSELKRKLINQTNNKNEEIKKMIPRIGSDVLKACGILDAFVKNVNILVYLTQGESGSIHLIHAEKKKYKTYKDIQERAAEYSNKIIEIQNKLISIGMVEKELNTLHGDDLKNAAANAGTALHNVGSAEKIANAFKKYKNLTDCSLADDQMEKALKSFIPESLLTGVSVVKRSGVVKRIYSDEIIDKGLELVSGIKKDAELGVLENAAKKAKKNCDNIKKYKDNLHKQISELDAVKDKLNKELKKELPGIVATYNNRQSKL